MPAAFLFFIALVMGILVPRSLYLIPLITGFGGTAFYVLREKKFPDLDRPWIVFSALICALPFLSLLWSVNPEDTLDRAITNCFILTGGVLAISLIEHLPPFCEKKQKYFTAAFFAAYAGCAAFLLFEYTNNFPVMNRMTAPEAFPSFGLNRSVVSLGIFFLPLLYMGFRMLHSRPAKLAAIVVASALMFTILYHTQSQTAQAALLCGIVVYGVAYILFKPAFRSTFIKACIGLVCVAMLATPLIPPFLQQQASSNTAAQQFVKDANILERLEIWTFVSEKIAQRPLTGHGVEATKNLDAEKVLPYNNTDNFLHPHNAFLQIWVETGLLGALLFCALMLFIGRRILAAPFIAQPLYVSMTAAALCMLSTGYGLWQSWHLGLLLTAAALAIFVTRISARQDL